MVRLLLLLIAPALVASSLRAQHAPDSTASDSTLAEAYRVFRADGRAASLDDVVAAMDAVEVVFLGEQHDDPVAHYLQAELLQQAYVRQARAAAGRPVALSLEMFARDVQPILDEYLTDVITESHFLRSSRPWQNYETDYRPMVEFAKVHRLPVLAANAPRRYVNRVSRLGPASLDALSVWAKAWLPPLPYPGPSPAYEAKWNRLMAEMMTPEADTSAHTAPADSTAPPGMSAPDSTAMPEKAGAADEAQSAASPMHGLGYMLDAQAFWDAAMAYTIHEHLYAEPRALVLHVAGSFHVEEGLGTPSQLEVYRPGTRRLVVVVKPVEDFSAFDAEEHGRLGDFVILTNNALPRSVGGSEGAGG